MILNTSVITEKISTRLKNVVPTLDGYCGITILPVIMYHCYIPIVVEPSGFLNQFSKILVKLGRIGVDDFFVVSDFRSGEFSLTNNRKGF